MTATLDRLAPYVVAAAVLGAAAGSSIQHDTFQVGRPARWVLLGVFVAFALARSAAAWPRWSFPPRVAFALATYCGLALVSTAWSVNGHGTLVRALGVAATITAAVALAGCTRASPALAGRLLEGVLAAAVIVAVAGFVYWLASPSSAVLEATAEYPSRYQGIEQNPNTPPLLFAFGIALAFAGVLRARKTLQRVAFGALLFVLAASVVASGSRGGLMGASVGVLVVALLAPATAARRAAVAGGCVVAVAVAAVVMTIPKPLSATAAPGPGTSASIAPNRDAESVLPLDQEIDNPWWTHRSGDTTRSLFNTSVRARALRGTWGRIVERPIVGYGFGAEQWAFVDRYYGYHSENPENGYVGILLQTGFVGLVVFLAALALCFVPGVRAAWRARDDVAVAAVGAATAGLALGLSQSFFHGPGNLAQVAFWISLLVTATVPLRAT